LQKVLPPWDDQVRHRQNGALSSDNDWSDISVRPVAGGQMSQKGTFFSPWLPFRSIFSMQALRGGGNRH
jgi:hypothetical protein